MKRSEIQKDPVLMSKVNRRYYSRPTDRQKLFQVSDQEVASASIDLQRKLKQNAERFEHRHVTRI